MTYQEYLKQNAALPQDEMLLFTKQTIRITCEVCGNNLTKKNANKNLIYVCINPSCENHWVKSRFCYLVNIKKIFGEI